MNNIKNFKRTLQVKDQAVEFDFHTVDARELRLFQVYADWEGQRIRFHLQKDNGQFHITKHHSCPDAIQEIEQDLINAVLTSQE